MENIQPEAQVSEAPAATEQQVETSDRPAQVEGTGSTSGQPEASAVNHTDNAAHASRRIIEKLSKRMDSLEQENQSLKTRYAQPAYPPASPIQPQIPDPFVDPEGHARVIARQEAAQAVQGALQREQLTNRIAKAEEYVLSQEYVNPDTDREELTALSKKHKLDVLQLIDPEAAAETLLTLWKSQKGITAGKNVSKMKAQTPPAAASVQNGKKVWSMAEINEIVKDPTLYEKHRVDLLAAQREGRVRA